MARDGGPAPKPPKKFLKQKRNLTVDPIGKKPVGITKKKRHDRHRSDMGRKLRDEDTSVIGDEVISEPDEKIEKKIAFCCSKCNCSEDRKETYKWMGGRDIYIQIDHQYHRRCCHRNPPGQVDVNWAPEVSLVGEAILEKLCSESIADRTATVTLRDENSEESFTVPVVEQGVEKEETFDQVFRKYRTAVAQENQMRKLDEDTFLVDTFLGQKEYEMMKEEFKKRHKREERAVVLDLFGGIGGGVLCLKRLGIHIDTIVHVEHDMVANIVYQDNLCGRDNDITHKIVSFELFMRKHKNEEYGHFDIVIAGPPCVDYTGINATRGGVNGVLGSYLPRTAELIREISERNKRDQHPYPLFLVENVRLVDADRKKIETAFGKNLPFAVYRVNSNDFTPLRRDRTYFSNIPLPGEQPLLDPPPRLCFDDGYDVAGKIVDPKLRHCKANTLMASIGRLDDDPRMMIYKEIPGDSPLPKFWKRAPTVAERERLMGFPAGYVSKPVHYLFENVKNGLDDTRGKPWKEDLDEKYHNFAGDFHGFKGEHRPYQFYIKFSERDDSFAWDVKMAPPLPEEGEADDAHEIEQGERGSRKPVYYMEEEYAKRLLGNTFSIPTIEWLLNPLRDVFGSRNYGYDDKFSWEEGWTDNEREPSTRVNALVSENPQDRVQRTASIDPENMLGDIEVPDPVAAAKDRQKQSKTSIQQDPSSDEEEFAFV